MKGSFDNQVLSLISVKIDTFAFFREMSQGKYSSHFHFVHKNFCHQNKAKLFHPEAAAHKNC